MIRITIEHDPLVCGLWNYGGPPLCPACRAELEAGGVRWPSESEQRQIVLDYARGRTREPGEDG